ncbi:serine acetyltransferase [Desulfococcaceae bacterium HSG7]|nr:serine acetyltransferase [Desulfococcaceae bacterium HSG7]
MISRIIITLFGSFWKLKTLCIKKNYKFIGKIYLFLYRLYLNEQGSFIAWDSVFTGVPCFPHGIKGVFISKMSKIGNNCVLFQQVTIGSNTLADSNNIGAPVIGDNCYIAAGAKIIGNIKIGNNVRIGANAVVYKDVGDNAVVVSGEQRTIKKKNTLNNRFYTYRKGWVYFDNGKWVQDNDPDNIAKLENM